MTRGHEPPILWANSSESLQAQADGLPSWATVTELSAFVHR